MSESEVRRTSRVHVPAMNPEERVRPLIERGGIHGTAQTTEAVPESPPSSQTSQDEEVMEPSVSDPRTSSTLGPNVIDLTQTEEAAAAKEPTHVENEVLDHANTNVALQELLRQAATFGGIFDPQDMEVELLNPTEVDSGGATQQEDDMVYIPMTGVEPVAAPDEENASAAVVIGLEKAHNDFMMEVALMEVGSRPTVAKVLGYLKHIENPRMQVLYRHLQQIPPEDAIVSTSKRPVAMKDLAVERGGWGIRPEIIGSIQEAHAQSLEQCMVCPETDRVRNSLTPPIPSSIPVLILYIERQDRASITATPSTTLAPQLLSSRSLHPPLNNVLQYLTAIVDAKYIRAYERHALHHSYNEKAFATMIFTRIVEEVCSQSGLPFTGHSLTHKTPTMNGPAISLEDIIHFFGKNTPTSFQGSVTSPSTFKNHRTCYSRIQSCVRAIEIRHASLDEEEQAFLELLKKLLNTEYDKLNTLLPSQYGRLNEFQERVNVLNNKLNGKAVKKRVVEES